MKTSSKFVDGMKGLYQNKNNNNNSNNNNIVIMLSYPI